MVQTRSASRLFLPLLPQSDPKILSAVPDENLSFPVAVTPSPSPTAKRRRKNPSQDDGESESDAGAASPARKAKSVTKMGAAKTHDDAITSDMVALINPLQPFVDMNVDPAQLRPSATLTIGQCFHWRVVQQKHSKNEIKTEQGTEGKILKTSAWGTHDAKEWVGVLRITQTEDSVVIVIRETPTTTLYRPLTSVPSGVDLGAFLNEYFQLNHCLESLYRQWSAEDPTRLATVAQCIPGVRCIEQDPLECLVTFLCSSNNNIPRITKMVSAIRKTYGDQLLTIGDHSFYSFPSLEQLKSATDKDLREVCGMGYRSKYLLETIKILEKKGGEKYLCDLRLEKDPRVVQEKLCEFVGVGRKVADCVALFSLRQAEAIPVDTHVLNIAKRDYDSKGLLRNMTTSSITPTLYHGVGDLFRNTFSEKAGWAHSLLFVAELPSFRAVLPEDIIKEMDAFRQREKKRKQKG